MYVIRADIRARSLYRAFVKYISTILGGVRGIDVDDDFRSINFQGQLTVDSRDLRMIFVNDYFGRVAEEAFNERHPRYFSN